MGNFERIGGKFNGNFDEYSMGKRLTEQVLLEFDFLMLLPYCLVLTGIEGEVAPTSEGNRFISQVELMWSAESFEHSVTTQWKSLP
jgi:hypothetical protein